jgi:pimeloyl-ACP methyl ester carboxylesterase
MSDSKTVERVSGRGQDTRNWEMKYNYSAKVSVLESPERNGSSLGRATINHSFSSIETIDAVEKNSCDRGKTWRDMRGTSTSKTMSSAKASETANVSVGVNSDGTYSVSVGLPPVRGTVSGETTSSYSGQCTPKEGKTLTSPASDTRIDGQSLTSDGSHRINEGDPNRISGSYTRSLPGNVTETITWSLQKCGAPLRITDLRFAHMKFPNWNDWQEIYEQAGTIDGNLIKITATVLNASGESKSGNVKFKETYKGDKWNGAMPDGPLSDTDVSVNLDAGEETEVEIVWDSSGYSWFDDGRPRLVQRIKAELEEKGKKVDEMTKNLKVAPKPVVLVHGLWSNWKAWETWQNILTTSHSYDWKAFPVGEKPEKGVMNTGGSFLSTQPTNSIAENARELEKYIRYAQEDRNAWHVDIVAHSMGGLISRYYIAQIMEAGSPDGRPKVAHLVMLGTPNMGSPCADVMDVAFEAFGSRVEAVRQLRQDHAVGFNRVNTARKGVKFSALAGNPLPTMCKSVVWNDGVVSVPSAKWIISDTAESKNIHTDLTGTSDFSSFVKPRLAVGPKGNHNPEAPQAIQAYVPDSDGPPPSATSRSYGARSWFAVFDTISSESMSVDPFAKQMDVGPGQIVDVEIPVAAAMDFGVTFMADPKLSAALMDTNGNVLGRNASGSPESRGWFRSIYYDKPTLSATWKLRVENTGTQEHRIIVTTWANASK